MSMWIGKQIEVTHISPSIRRMGILIHLNCSPHEITTPEVGARIQQLVWIGCRYLLEEDMIPENLDGWQTDIAAVAHGNNTTTT